MTGAEIGDAILQRYGALPWLRLFRRHAGRHQIQSGAWVTTSVEGLADYWGFTNRGEHLEIEVKGQGDRLRPAQRCWRDTCLRMGVIYILARSVDDVASELTARGYDVGEREGRGS